MTNLTPLWRYIYEYYSPRAWKRENIDESLGQRRNTFRSSIRWIFNVVFCREPRCHWSTEPFNTRRLNQSIPAPPFPWPLAVAATLPSLCLPPKRRFSRHCRSPFTKAQRFHYKFMLSGQEMAIGKVVNTQNYNKNRRTRTIKIRKITISQHKVKHPAKWYKIYYQYFLLQPSLTRKFLIKSVKIERYVINEVSRLNGNVHVNLSIHKIAWIKNCESSSLYTVSYGIICWFISTVWRQSISSPLPCN